MAVPRNQKLEACIRPFNIPGQSLESTFRFLATCAYDDRLIDDSVLAQHVLEPPTREWLLNIVPLSQKGIVATVSPLI